MYPPDQVPHGIVFFLYEEPTGIGVDGSGEPAWVEFMIEGFVGRAEVEPGDRRVDVAHKLARAFERKGLTTFVSPTGDWIICESPHGDEVTSMGAASRDTGLSTGFRTLRY